MLQQPMYPTPTAFTTRSLKDGIILFHRYGSFPPDSKANKATQQQLGRQIMTCTQLTLENNTIASPH